MNYREFYGTGENFYVFLNSTSKGSNAMYLPGIVWVDQEVILINPRFIGTYKGSAVLELTNTMLPIRTIPEPRDVMDWKLDDNDYDKIVGREFNFNDGCGDGKHLLRSYRYRKT